MRVYHGSPEVVAHPKLELCRPRNDYGLAFYCTFDKDLACEWACPDCHTSGYINEYELNMNGLVHLDLDKAPNGVLDWIAVLLANRPLDREWNAGQDATLYLERYGFSLEPYDVVSGYRCDDSYFSIARAFVQGALTDAQLASALQLGKLGRQIALRKQAAFDALEFVGSSPVDPHVYGARRMRRDAKARAAFRELRLEAGPMGRYVHELAGSQHKGRFINELGE